MALVNLYSNARTYQVEEPQHDWCGIRLCEAVRHADMRPAVNHALRAPRIVLHCLVLCGTLWKYETDTRGARSIPKHCRVL